MRKKEAKAIAKTLRNRIIGSGNENPATILSNPKNWRTHTAEQKAALSGLLEEVGWVAQVLINKRTGRLIDGHLRVELAKTRKEAKIPVVYVDLSPKEESIVLAALDPLGDLAGTDSKRLRTLIAELDPVNESLKDFLVDLGDPNGEADKDKPEVPFTEELLEEHNFVVLYFDTGVDWLNLLSILKLKTVKALHSRKGFNSAGVGRVVRGPDAIAKIQAAAKHGH